METLRVRVEGPETHQEFLETVLAMGAPGLFEIVHGGVYDVAVVALGPGILLPGQGASGPYIVVPPWAPALAEVKGWMQDGAHDVLAMGEMTSRRLADALVKAAHRTSIHPTARVDALTGATPGLVLSEWHEDTLSVQG